MATHTSSIRQHCEARVQETSQHGRSRRMDYVQGHGHHGGRGSHHRMLKIGRFKASQTEDGNVSNSGSRLGPHHLKRQDSTSPLGETLSPASGDSTIASSDASDVPPPPSPTSLPTLTLSSVGMSTDTTTSSITSSSSSGSTSWDRSSSSSSTTSRDYTSSFSTSQVLTDAPSSSSSSNTQDSASHSSEPPTTSDHSTSESQGQSASNSWSAIPWPPSSSSSRHHSSSSNSGSHSHHPSSSCASTSSHYSHNHSSSNLPSSSRYSPEPSSSSYHSSIPSSFHSSTPSSSYNSSTPSLSHSSPSSTITQRPTTLHSSEYTPTATSSSTSSRLPSSLSDDPKSGSGFASNTAGIIGVSVAAGIIILSLGLLLFFCCKRCRTRKREEPPPPTVSRANLIGAAGWRSPLSDEDDGDYRYNTPSGENARSTDHSFNISGAPMSAASSEALGLVGMVMGASSSSHDHHSRPYTRRTSTDMAYPPSSFPVNELSEPAPESDRSSGSAVLHSQTTIVRAPIPPEDLPSSLLNPPRAQRTAESEPEMPPPPTVELWDDPFATPGSEHATLPSGIMFMQSESRQESLLDNVDYSRPFGALYTRKDSTHTTTTLRSARSAHSGVSADDGHRS